MKKTLLGKIENISYIFRTIITLSHGLVDLNQDDTEYSNDTVCQFQKLITYSIRVKIIITKFTDILEQSYKDYLTQYGYIWNILMLCIMIRFNNDGDN